MKQSALSEPDPRGASSGTTPVPEGEPPQKSELVPGETGLQLAQAATTSSSTIQQPSGQTPANQSSTTQQPSTSYGTSQQPSPQKPSGQASALSSGYQEVPRDLTVLERPRPEVAPLGIHLGGFYAYPQLTVTEAYNDNVFATSSNHEDDFITQVAPDLRLESSWNNHALNFDAGAAAGYYADHPDQNYVDYHVGTDGRLDVRRDNQLTGSASFQHLHEARTSPNNRQGKEQTEYDLYTGSVGDQQELGRFTVNIDGLVDRYDFSNTQAFGGGTIHNSDRDRVATEGTAKVSYEIAPNYQAYVRTTYNRQQYDSSRDNSGFDRDSQGYESVAGLAIDLGGITRADIFGGYRGQYYQDSAFKTVAGPSYGASLTWNATGITTVTAALSRTIQETTTAGASGYYSTDATLSIDHELLRNLLLNVNGGYANHDYQGIHRIDNVWHAGAGAHYLMNRYVWLNAQYEFDSRDSDVNAQGFDRNLFLLSMELKL